MTVQDGWDPLERAFYPIWRDLLGEAESVLVGLSGGGDSMALVSLALAVNSRAGQAVEIIVAHVDHGLREDSDQEAEELEAYVHATFGLKLERVRVSVDSRSGWGMEMAARTARHGALEALRGQRGADLIALAHQADDQAETVLMRLLTGTGLAGLAAMSPRRDQIVRPLLSFTRHQLRQYLARMGITWLDDPSNQDRHYVRNRIRLDVLPYLSREVNPQVDRALRDLAFQARAWREMAEQYVDTFLAKHRLALNGDHIHWPSAVAELPEPAQSLLLARFAMHHGLRINAHHVQPVLRHRSVSWPGQWQVAWTGDGALCFKHRTNVPEARADQSLETPVGFVPGRVPWAPGQVLSVERTNPTRLRSPVDAADMVFSWVQKPEDAEWYFRRWQPGDRLRPVGLGGSKKVQDVFVDRKVPRGLRHQWPILVTRPGDIISVVGLADDELSRQTGTAWTIGYRPSHLSS